MTKPKKQPIELSILILSVCAFIGAMLGAVMALALNIGLTCF